MSAPADVVWVVNVYQIALVATLLPLGALGEIIGHERIYLGGLALFTLASLACACSWSLESLLGRAGAAGHRRQRHHEREYRAGAFRLSKPVGRSRLRQQRAGGCDLLHIRPDHRVHHPGGRSLALAFRGQSAVRHHCDPDRVEDPAADAAGAARFRFSGRGDGLGLPWPVHHRARQRRAQGAAADGRHRTGCRAGARLDFVAPACRPSGADAADRPVQAAGVRPVRRHRGLLVRGPGSGLRIAALLLRGRVARDRRSRPASS